MSRVSGVWRCGAGSAGTRVPAVISSSRPSLSAGAWLVVERVLETSLMGMAFLLHHPPLPFPGPLLTPMRSSCFAEAGDLLPTASRCMCLCLCMFL